MVVKSSNGLVLGGVSIHPLYLISRCFVVVVWEVSFVFCFFFVVLAAGFLSSSSSVSSVSAFVVSFVLLLLSGVGGGVGWRSRVASGVIAVDLASLFGVWRTSVFVGVPVITAVAKVNLVFVADDRVVLMIGVVASLTLLGVKVAVKSNLFCRASFIYVSFACATFVCLVFSPRRGDEFLPLPPEGLFLLDFLAIVGYSGSCGRLGT